MKKFCAVIITIITAITNCCVGFASPFGDKLEMVYQLTQNKLICLNISILKKKLKMNLLT